MKMRIDNGGVGVGSAIETGVSGRTGDEVLQAVIRFWQQQPGFIAAQPGVAIGVRRSNRICAGAARGATGYN